MRVPSLFFINILTIQFLSHFVICYDDKGPVDTFVNIANRLRDYTIDKFQNDQNDDR
jgi:hypothetical protein